MFPKAQDQTERKILQSLSALPGSMGDMLVLLLIVALANNADYFKLRKPKVDVSGSSDLSEYDFDDGGKLEDEQMEDEDILISATNAGECPAKAFPYAVKIGCTSRSLEIRGLFVSFSHLSKSSCKSDRA